MDVVQFALHTHAPAEGYEFVGHTLVAHVAPVYGNAQLHPWVDALYEPPF